MSQVLMFLHLLRLSCVGEAIGRYCLMHCYIKLLSNRRTFTEANCPSDKFVITSYRLKTNFDCKTALTTKRGYIEKFFKFNACTKQIPRRKCVL